jgi:membrane associated rhomboid family serine protease
MSSFKLPGDDEPVFYLGETPVRLIALLVGIHAGALVVLSLLAAAGHAEFASLLSFDSQAVAHGQVWRMVTYAFVSAPSVWFLLEMLMLYYFGREVENGLGWRRFAILYVGLILLGPVLLQAFASTGQRQVLAGAQEVNFAVFAAFVAMHPGAQFFFGLAARWVYLGLLAVSSLQLLSDRQPARLAVLLASCLMAMFMIRKSGFNEPLLGYGFRWPFSGGKGSSRQPVFSVVRGGQSASERKTRAGGEAAAPSEPHPEEVLDLLLEKIGRQGLSSLTAEERGSLEKARKAILLRGGDASH